VNEAAPDLFAAALFAAWLRASAPLIWAALGALVSELAGVINVGIEGLMLVAAFFGVAGSAWVAMTWPGSAPGLAALVGALCGLIAAVALALALGWFHLRLGADLIVAGIVVNLLAAGATVFLLTLLSGDKGSSAGLASAVLPVVHVPGLSDWPVLDAWVNGDGGQGHHVLVHGAWMAALALAWLLYRTRLGVHLRAVGENAEAARAAGLNVERLQYIALALSGALAGLGGLYLSMGYLSLFQADMTGGRGFLALAAVFLGARSPLGTLAAALLFGAASVAAAQLGLWDVPTQLVHMLPALITLALLVAASQWRRHRLQRRARSASSLRSPSSNL